MKVLKHKQLEKVLQMRTKLPLGLDPAPWVMAVYASFTHSPLPPPPLPNPVLLICIFGSNLRLHAGSQVAKML